VAPAGAIKAPQGWITIRGSQRQLPARWAAVGRPDLYDDPRFRTNTGRLEHLDELVEIVEGWMATFDTDDEVMAALEAERVPCGLVIDPADAARHPYFTERRMVRQVSDPLIGTFDVPGFPLRYSDAPPEPDLVTPALGEHNREVLRDIGGFADPELEALEADGVLQSKEW
jgi:CoA:oxalate CoA-transferase